MIKFIFLMLMISSVIVTAEDYKDGVHHINQRELSKKLENDNVVLIDVRTDKEYQSGHLEGAINISHKDILSDPSVLQEYKDKDIVFYCHTGVRVKYVTDVLSKTRDDLFHLKGDYRKWEAFGKEIVRPSRKRSELNQ